jgi:antirestriction protein ArdC
LRLATNLRMARDLDKSFARLRLFQDELVSQIDERERMTAVLGLEPSANDNLDLINQLEKVLRVMRYLEEDLTRELATIPEPEYTQA